MSLIRVLAVMTSLLILPLTARYVAADGIPQRLATLEATVTALQATVAALQGQVTSLASANAALQTQLVALDAAVNALEGNAALALGQYVTVDPNPINGLAGPHVIITGANVHVRSGSGATFEGPSPSGLGNFIVGYNEEPLLPPLAAGDRGGSHSVVIGEGHRFSNVGGLVAGFHNTVSGDYASVTGGSFNSASGSRATVSGGLENVASGFEAAISGGEQNSATYQRATVSGGNQNIASGSAATVSGGFANTASNFAATVGGGASRSAIGGGNWVAGTLFQDN